MKFLRGESGLTLIEILISSSIILSMFAGLGYKMKSIKKQLSDTARLMAVDALEGSLIDFMKTSDIIAYSLERSGSNNLRRCFLGQAACTHNSKFEIPLFREGQALPFTGPRTIYDRNAVPCGPKDLCEGPRLSIRTIVSPQCMQGSTCQGTGYTLVIAEIYQVETGKILRKIVQEVEKYGEGKFPGLNLRCSDANSVLHGIGLRGEPLCTPQQEIRLLDRVAQPVPGELVVTPRDCSDQNKSDKDQSFVKGIGADGVISCAPRFW